MRRKWLLVLVGTLILFMCLGFELLMKWNEVHAASKTEAIESIHSAEARVGSMILPILGVTTKVKVSLPITGNDEPIAEWKIQEAFEGLITAKDSIMPPQTKVQNIIFLDGDLLVDFSQGFLGYGGNTYEEALVNLILATGFGFPDIKSITVFIEGEPQNFVEGSEINRYTREEWQERKVNDE